MAAVVLDGHPRAERGFPEAAEPDHADDALPVPLPRLQQGQHAGVVVYAVFI